MVTSVASQAELQGYLEECVRTLFPAAPKQDILNAVNTALGEYGYMLCQERHDDQLERSIQHPHVDLAAVREAAIYVAHSIPDPAVKLAAIACAWSSYAATCAWQEERQQRLQGNHSIS